LDSSHNIILTSAAGGGGTPAGSDTQIQFNDGGSSFGASANLTFDDTFLASSRAIFGTTAATLTVAAGELSTLSAMDSGSNKYTTQYDAVGRLQGHVLSMGGSTTVAGQIYYLSSSGGFHAAQADDDDEGGSQLLAIALNTNSTTHGMLRRGTVRITGSLVDDEMEIGSPVYISKTTAGRYQFATPSGSGEYVRQVGYCLDVNVVSGDDADMLLLFEPSDTFIEIA
jgi:YD repeat-containing protein